MFVSRVLIVLSLNYILNNYTHRRVAQCVTHKIIRILNDRNGYQKSNTISLVNFLPWPFIIYEYKSPMVVKIFKSSDKWFTFFLVIISSYWFRTAIASVCVLPAHRFVAVVCKTSRVRYSRGEAQVSWCGLLVKTSSVIPTSYKHTGVPPFRQQVFYCERTSKW